MATKKDKKNEEQAKIETRGDLVKFYQALSKVPRKGAKFSYAVSKNFRRVGAEVEDMMKVLEPTEKLKKYQEELEEHNKKHARKDEKDNIVLLPAIIDGEKVQVYDVIGKGTETSDYEVGLEKLKKKFKEEIEAHEKKEEDYKEFLKEEIKWEPLMIGLGDYPDAASDFMDSLIYMVREVKEL